MADPTVIVIKDVPSPWAAYGALAADFTFAAGTVTDGDTFVCTGRELLLVQNPTAGALNITIVATDDETNRAESITYAVPVTGTGAGFSVFGIGLTTAKGWKGTTGLVRITVASADLRVAVLRLPAGYP